MKDPDPSKPLKNGRWELFAQSVFGGSDQKSAYIKAGYKSRDNSAEAEASVLIRNPKVLARLQYLQSRAAQGKIITKQRAMEILSEMIECDLSDFMTVGADGVTHFDFGKDTAKRKALKKAKTKTVRDESGNEVMETMYQEMELESKTAALERLAKMMGWDQPLKQELTGADGKPLNEPIKIVVEHVTINADHKD